ncbi:MAG: hypothetical protein ACOYIR_07260 [Christensenellales bacterium]|jgi:hypothetical protein
MKPKYILLRLAALVAAAVFLVKAPPMIQEQLQRNFYGEWVRTTPSEWKGVISLMNVYTDARFDSDALMRAVKRYEKQNRGAFISHSTVPKDSVEALLMRKRPPDIWIFPEGYMETREGDIVITLPKPPEDHVIIEDFEFDILEPDATEPEEERTQRFVVSVRAEGEKGACAKAFAELLYELTDTAH